mmetsp:Transcript_8718/g.21268  ORF Transcript_8718/g.21268 Transcript_8718/m.21268 type:complete len:200 (-) Transcript_8718:1183-1782(-)
MIASCAVSNSVTMFTEEIDASGRQNPMASLIGLHACTGDRGNSSIIFASTFFTSRRLLIRFSNKPDDAMISLRDSRISLLKSLALSTSMLVTPIMPCNGVLSSCVNVTIDSPMAFAIIASSCAFCSASSFARPAVISLNTTKNRSLGASPSPSLFSGNGVTSSRKMPSPICNSPSLGLLESSKASTSKYLFSFLDGSNL